ncbi:enoyl-CoA hydratase-related protein, partial [Acinetobacter tandoii]
MNNTNGTVSREVQDHLLFIGLDRASKRNAFDSHMILALSQALTEYEADPALRCAVIFAHGDHFTAGLDLLELQDKLAQGVFNFGADQIDPWGVTGKSRTKPVVV